MSYLVHSAKGREWKDHKYISKEFIAGKWVYHYKAPTKRDNFKDLPLKEYLERELGNDSSVSENYLKNLVDKVNAISNELSKKGYSKEESEKILREKYEPALAKYEYQGNQYRNGNSRLYQIKPNRQPSKEQADEYRKRLNKGY